jgi:hypothetical protein
MFSNAFRWSNVRTATNSVIYHIISLFLLLIANIRVVANIETMSICFVGRRCQSLSNLFGRFDNRHPRFEAYEVGRWIVGIGGISEFGNQSLQIFGFCEGHHER